MDKERETGDGTLDRFSHYPYAPSTGLMPPPPLPPPGHTYGGSSGGGNYANGVGVGHPRTGALPGSSDTSLDASQPLPSVLKRNQSNLLLQQQPAAFAYPPGFVDPQQEDLNQVIKQTLLNNGKLASLERPTLATPPSSSLHQQERLEEQRQPKRVTLPPLH